MDAAAGGARLSRELYPGALLRECRASIDRVAANPQWPHASGRVNAPAGPSLPPSLPGTQPLNRTVPLILAVALFMENMDSTVIATSLPAIAHDIGTSPIALKLALTAYLVSLAIFQFQAINPGDCGFAWSGASVKDPQARNMPASCAGS